MPLRRSLALLLAVALLALPNAASAAIATFTYAGSDPDDSYVQSTGTLNFSYADGATTLGLSSVTSFQFLFTITSTDPSLRYQDTFTFTQADLASFAATVSAGQITALSFRTGYESPPDGYLAPEYLVASSLRRGGLVSYFGPGDDAQHGTLTAASNVVPEPSSLALLGIAASLGLVGQRWSRRGRARA